jgi:hypothetical protein
MEFEPQRIFPFFMGSIKVDAQKDIQGFSIKP